MKETKKTKPDFILRELSFQIGDTLTLAELKSNFDESRDNLFNTDLFDKISFDTLHVDSTNDGENDNKNNSKKYK